MVGANEATISQEKATFELLTQMGHEQLVFCNDENTGLKAIIGIHNTVLGPSLGGTRMWNYTSEHEAIRDVLRLSRGMTFKASISGLNLGGGKAVIIGDASTMKTEALLRRFGKFVESLNGKYVTAEDVNMSPRDMEYIRMETRHVSGLSESIGGGGDPSPVTAYGVYVGMKACAKKVYGSDNLKGKKILIQGVGNVGKSLCELLAKDGAILYVSDIFPERVKEVCNTYKATSLENGDIFNADIDIYSPCALGATINDDSIDLLRCDIVAGAANNQLEDEVKHGDMLLKKGILYAPDFLINAGGLINVGIDYLGGWSKQRVYAKVEQIYDTTLSILNKSQKENINTQKAAIALATKRINDIGKVKLPL